MSNLIWHLLCVICYVSYVTLGSEFLDPPGSVPYQTSPSPSLLEQVQPLLPCYHTTKIPYHPTIPSLLDLPITTGAGTAISTMLPHYHTTIPPYHTIPTRPPHHYWSRYIHYYHATIPYYTIPSTVPYPTSPSSSVLEQGQSLLPGLKGTHPILIVYTKQSPTVPLVLLN